MIQVRNLTSAGLNRIPAAGQRAGMNLNQDILRSFMGADLVIQGKPNGELECMAAEIRWTMTPVD